jgi:hypothetical protein
MNDDIRIKIKEPIWKSKSVGIADKHLQMKDFVEIEILYKQKDGTRLYPGVFRMSVRQVKSYPQQVFGNGLKLRVVPIVDLQQMAVV